MFYFQATRTHPHNRRGLWELHRNYHLLWPTGGLQPIHGIWGRDADGWDTDYARAGTPFAFHILTSCSLYLQGFFAWREWTVLPHPWRFVGLFCAGLAVLRCAVALYAGAEALFTTSIPEYSHKHRAMLATLLSSGAAIDILIAISMLWFLGSRRKKAFERVARMLDKLVAYTIRMFALRWEGIVLFWRSSSRHRSGYQYGGGHDCHSRESLNRVSWNWSHKAILVLCFRYAWVPVPLNPIAARSWLYHKWSGSPCTPSSPNVRQHFADLYLISSRNSNSSCTAVYSNSLLSSLNSRASLREAAGVSSNTASGSGSRIPSRPPVRQYSLYDCFSRWDVTLCRLSCTTDEQITRVPQHAISIEMKTTTERAVEGPSLYGVRCFIPHAAGSFLDHIMCIGLSKW